MNIKEWLDVFEGELFWMLETVGEPTTRWVEPNFGSGLVFHLENEFKPWFPLKYVNSPINLRIKFSTGSPYYMAPREKGPTTCEKGSYIIQVYLFAKVEVNETSYWERRPEFSFKFDLENTKPSEVVDAINKHLVDMVIKLDDLDLIRKDWMLQKAKEEEWERQRMACSIIIPDGWPD